MYGMPLNKTFKWYLVYNIYVSQFLHLFRSPLITEHLFICVFVTWTVCKQDGDMIDDNLITLITHDSWGIQTSAAIASPVVLYCWLLAILMIEICNNLIVYHVIVNCDIHPTVTGVHFIYFLLPLMFGKSSIYI